MSIKVGICGVGAFADCFIPLFRAHPLVSEVTLCDLDPDKLRAKAERFDIRATSPSLDDLCTRDVDAIAIFSQNWLHGPQAVQALQAGKHVYSAVPSAISMEEITALVRTVEATGRIYMVGETSYYYPCAIYCRERFRRGDFGEIVYGEGEYYHDWDHGLYEVMKWRGGEDWRRFAGSPPMYYPTHSMSLIVSVTGAYATHVACFGFVDHHEDGIYAPGANIWDNVFSNETALCRMSDGSAFRLNEFRRIGHPGTVGMSLYGTLGSYEEQTGSQVWVTKNWNEREDLTELLAPVGIPVSAGGDMDKVTSADGTHEGASRVHDVGRLPKEFIGLPNGHLGSHQFLVDDFVQACVTGQQPPCNVWQAARYLIPGLIAHESAKQGGVLLEVPDFGPGRQRKPRERDRPGRASVGAVTRPRLTGYQAQAYRLKRLDATCALGRVMMETQSQPETGPTTDHDDVDWTCRVCGRQNEAESDRCLRCAVQRRRPEAQTQDSMSALPRTTPEPGPPTETLFGALNNLGKATIGLAKVLLGLLVIWVLWRGCLVVTEVPPERTQTGDVSTALIPAGEVSAPTLDTTNWPDVASLHGSGNQVTTRFSCPMPWRVRWSCQTRDNFVVYLCDSGGEDSRLLVNEIGPGKDTYYPEMAAEDHYLKIEASGPWTVVIERRD